MVAKAFPAAGALGIRYTGRQPRRREAPMPYNLTESEFNTVSLLSPGGRYDYFVKMIVIGGELWSLKSDEGWVVMSSEEGEECLPVWPHKDFAAEWVTDEWADCKPTAIALDEWVGRWTPGMEKDGTLLAIFPDEQSEGTITVPADLLNSIEAQRNTD